MARYAKCSDLLTANNRRLVILAHLWQSGGYKITWQPIRKVAHTHHPKSGNNESENAARDWNRTCDLTTAIQTCHGIPIAASKDDTPLAVATEVTPPLLCVGSAPESTGPPGVTRHLLFILTPEPGGWHVDPNRAFDSLLSHRGVISFVQVSSATVHSTYVGWGGSPKEANAHQ